MREVVRDFPFSSFLAKDTKDFLITYLQRFKSQQTQLNYCHAINEFADLLQKDLKCVSAGDCERYIRHLESRWNAGHIMHSTIIKKKYQLSGVYTVLCTPHVRKLLSLPESFENFFLNIRLERAPETMKYEKVPSLDEIDILHRFLSVNDPMIGVAFLLAFKGFLTTEEFRNLSVSDFFIDANNKMVVRIANPSFPPDVRYNSIPDDLKEIFLTYFNSLNTLFPDAPAKLFAKKDGNLYTARYLRLRLREACDACGIKRYTFNDFRNAATVFAKSYGADVSVIANSMGYKTNRHIGKLESLQVNVNDAADLLGISFKATRQIIDG